MMNKFFFDRPFYWEAEVHTDTSIREENEFDVDEGNQRLCDACMLPIFSSPYESRSPDSLLHQRCAQLPQVFIKHPLHLKEPLHLHKLFDGDRSNLICQNCGETIKGYFYQCSNQRCRFTLDIKCVSTITIVHRSHKHELTFICDKECLFTCEGCGLEHKGQFYYCRWCHLYLHRDCALLPNTILHKKHSDIIDGQQHPLTLTFNLPTHSFKFIKSKDACFICRTKLSSIKAGIYFCTKCKYAVHVKCAISDPADLHPVSSGEIAGGLPHFPMKDEGTSLIHYLQEKKSFISTSVANEEEKNIDNHDLILHEEFNIEEPAGFEFPYICNACIDPINIFHPFYTCSHKCQCTSNHLYLHKSCTNLPVNLQHPLHYIRGKGRCKEELLVLLPTQFPFLFPCSSGCRKFCNGYLYSCKKCGFKLDVKCALLPDAITYELHAKYHILFLSYSPSAFKCYCCKLTLYSDLFYECSSCPNFKIHARCVILPSSVLHKYDRHPLKLTPYDESSTPKDDDEDFCEICENGMGSVQEASWFYHCKECITSFHIYCIPCVGWGSKIKYGKSIRVGIHDCPLTCIRPLNSYSYTCGLCETTIQGKEEVYVEGTIAFECAKCGFWLDARCAEMNSIDDE